MKCKASFLKGTILSLGLLFMTSPSASALTPLKSVFAVTPNLTSLDENTIRMYSQNDIEFYNPVCSTSSSGSSNRDSAIISGYKSKEKVWSGLRSKNYIPEIVAGIMGNMQVESDFNPARYEQQFRDVWESGFDWETSNESGHGVGLIQWSGERRVSLFNYLRTENNNLTEKYLKKPNTYGGLSGDDFIKKAESDSDANALYSLELNFLDQELTKTSDFKAIFDQKTVEDATKFFAKTVEGCTSCEDGTETMKNRIAAANEIFAAFNGKTYEKGESAAVTGDFSNIAAAKNANESVSAVDESSEWYAGWSDTDTNGLKRVLEHYGDLAYQTGRALNVPWQAIIVQMRYENPKAKCGDSASPNNFWGMGCTSGSVAKSKENLGQGFTEYANFVTNEFQKHAIGIQDPYEYLVELGPSWVQGCKRTESGWVQTGKNPCIGYSSINDMKKSLKVLEDFIQTPEGQAIVQSFGNYSVNSHSSSDNCCDPNSTSLNKSGTYKGDAYNLSDEDLDTLILYALAENNSSLEATASELSLMANRFQIHGKGFSSVLDYVENSGWFGSSPKPAEISSELKTAAIDIIRNGNRTIPLQIVQHATFGSKYLSISTGDADNRSQYQSGVTIVHELFGSGAEWVFWNWADQTKGEGDPFGYEKDNPPADSVTQPTKGSTTKASAGSSVTWTEDGWISGGMNTYHKDSLEDLPQQETWGADYLTDSLSSKHNGKGPNKILLHVTEGGSSGGDSVHSIYAGQLDANKGKTVPPHFTVDIKNKIIYQHQSIWKASSAIVSDDEGNGDLTAGIQIEIVGYDYGNTGGEWDLTNETIFGDEQWSYLAEFLNAISVETGIPLTSSVDWADNDSVRMTDLEEFKNYQGILSHKHAPLNDHSDISEAVWKNIEAALSAFSTAQQDVCGPSATGNLQQTLLAFAWEEYQESGPKRTTPKEAYYKAIHKEGAYIADSDNGLDCGVFVTAIVRESGIDPNYNSARGNTTTQLEYVKNPENGWQDVTDTIKSNEDAHPGDVLLTKEGYTGHTLIYVGKVPGFGSVMASASYHERVPMADRSQDIMSYINGDSLGRKYYVFRKVK